MILDILKCIIDMEICIEIWIDCYNVGNNRMLVVIKKIINVFDNEVIIIKVIELVDVLFKINDFLLDRNEILYGILIFY